MNLPTFKLRYLRKILQWPIDGFEITKEEARKGLEYLGPAKRSEKVKTYRRAARAEGAKKIAAHRMSTKQIRAACMERAANSCEGTGGHGADSNCSGPLELDHWLSGSGRRRQKQSVENTWILCRWHHLRRTRGLPCVAEWNARFAAHCADYGYPFTPHVEHAPLPKRGTAWA